MNEENIKKDLEQFFGSGAEEEGMWKIVSKFAAQLDEMQILALTKLEYIAKICSPDVHDRLMAFIDRYLELCNNRNTAMFMVRMAEMNALKHYFTGIEGKIQVQK